MKRLTTFTAALACAWAAAAQTVPSDDVERLKPAYLACDERATQTVLDRDSAARCSQIGEALLKLGFDGDFERLLQWWRIAKAERMRLAGPPRQ